MSESAYADFVASAQADDRVVGLVLTGSRGRQVFVQPSSDWDVRLVVRDDVLDECVEQFCTARGSAVEVVVYSLSDFEKTAAIGSHDEWDRYSYTHAEIGLEKLNGEIARMVAEKAVLPSEVADRLGAAALDGYINSYYRSAKNVDAGLTLESHLDAAESVAHFLTALFNLHRRVRPFNKFLRWELENFPLDGEPWQAKSLLPRLEAITASGALAEQRLLFNDVERFARERGFDAVIDGWDSDLPSLRGSNGLRG